MPLFKGLSAFPITPADAGGRVEAEGVRRLVRRLADAGVDSIGLLGSTGTYAYLSRAERRRAIEAAVAEVSGEVPLLVGAGALRTDDAVALARDAAAAGADALLLAPVSYTPLTEDEVFVHFETVARATSLPLCIYNNPGTTHFSFSDALIARLAEVAPIVAVKNPAPEPADAGARIAALRALVPAGFSLGYSADWNTPEALIAGGDAWYSVAGGLFPKPCLDIVRAIEAGDIARAREANARLAPLWALFKQFTSLRVVYAAGAILGLHAVEPPRPILPLGAEARQRVAEVIDQLGLA